MALAECLALDEEHRRDPEMSRTIAHALTMACAPAGPRTPATDFHGRQRERGGAAGKLRDSVKGPSDRATVQSVCPIGTIPQMADSVWRPISASAGPATTVRPRHSALVRVTHWITTLAFLALLVSGVVLLISHPRLCCAAARNARTTPFLHLRIPHPTSLY